LSLPPAGHNTIPIQSFDLLGGTSIAWGSGTNINESEDAIEKGGFAL